MSGNSLTCIQMLPRTGVVKHAAGSGRFLDSWMMTREPNRVFSGVIENLLQVILISVSSLLFLTEAGWFSLTKA